MELMLTLSETVDQIAVENNVCWHGHVLRRKEGRSKRTWKKQVEEESIKVGLSREDALC